jgi:hypothetical protein
MRFADAMNRVDRTAMLAILTEDFTTEWPQSGERVRGFDNFWATIENYPGFENAPVPNDPTTLRSQPLDAVQLVAPSFTFVTVEGAGKAGMFTLRTTYPDGSIWWVVTIYRLREGRMSFATTFFAPEFEAPAWRAQWVEKIS